MAGKIEINRITNANIYVNGNSLLGRAEEIKLPDISAIMQALKLYKLDNRRYPSAEQGLQALVTKPAAAPVPDNWKSYLDKLPLDPWGKPYQYVVPGLKGEVDVMSFGADGLSGGEGFDADIGSWSL